jgi:hypothetical protein
VLCIQQNRSDRNVNNCGDSGLGVEGVMLEAVLQVSECEGNCVPLEMDVVERMYSVSVLLLGPYCPFTVENAKAIALRGLTLFCVASIQGSPRVTKCPPPMSLSPPVLAETRNLKQRACALAEVVATNPRPAQRV